jgi:hypothetical protein
MRIGAKCWAAPSQPGQALNGDRRWTRRSSASVAFLLTRVEAAEDKASEKLIALPDRPAKALLAEKACDRRPLVIACQGTASKAVIPTKVEPRGAHLPRQKSLRASKSTQKGKDGLAKWKRDA